MRHALTVEDAAVAAEQLNALPDRPGHPEHGPSHGAGAFERVLDLRPDVVLLDILLPDVSGWEVLRQLKGDDRTRDIPVVVVSVVDDRPRGAALGADAYLVKPVAPPICRRPSGNLLERAGLRIGAVGPGGSRRPPAADSGR